MHYECELAVVIGKPARRVAPRRGDGARRRLHVANDYAIRDYLENWYRPNLRVKSRDGAHRARALAGRRRRRRGAAAARAAHARQRPADAEGNTRDLVFDIAVPDRIPERVHDACAGRRDPDRNARRRRQRRRRRRGRLRDRRPRPAGQHASPATPSSAARTRRWRKGIRMRVEHLIDGRPVAGRELLRDRRPGDPGGARRGRARRRRRDRTRRWRRRRRRSRPGRGTPPAERARADAPPRRPDHGARAGALRDRDARHRPGDRADEEAARAARRRQLPLLRRDLHARRRPHLSDADAPQLHALSSRSACAR